MADSQSAGEVDPLAGREPRRSREAVSGYDRTFDHCSEIPFMSKRRARDLERVYSRAQFIAKLRRLADSLEKQQPFTIQVAGERLHIPAQAQFNIEHERAAGEQELEFQLKWRTDEVITVGYATL